jgi:hypothetical protein
MIDTLKTSLAARIEEVAHYQLNIDNYRRAIVKADADPEMAAFAEQLRHLLSTSLIEQKKAQIMLDVVREQLEEMGE